MNLYGVVVTLGVVVGAFVAERARVSRVTRLQGDALQSIWDVLPWVVASGIIGARLYHVIDLWSYYRENLILVPQVWTGGLGIFGGILGGVVGLAIKLKDKKQLVGYLDLLGFGAPLGQAIGRWGNYFNQELYGRATDMPWGIYIDAERGYFHPLFLYESLWNVGVFMVLLWVLKSRKLRLIPGSLFTLYVLFYSIGRFFLEGMRVDPWMVFGVPVAGLVSLVAIAVSISILLKQYTNNPINK